MSKNFNISFEYPEEVNNINNIRKINSMDKWSQLDSIINKKNRSINFKDNFFDFIDNKKYSKTKSNNSNFIDKINLQYLIHPINDEFDEFIDEKIEILEKLKDNKYQLKSELNPNFEEKINLSNILKKYKKEEESIIKAKNEPIYVLKDNTNDLNIKNEFNKMKSNKYFFKENKENSTDIGKRNKIRLNNILNKIKKEKPKNQIINIPNKFNIEKNNMNININNTEENNKDYFDTILEEIKSKK